MKIVKRLVFGSLCLGLLTTVTCYSNGDVDTILDGILT